MLDEHSKGMRAQVRLLGGASRWWLARSLLALYAVLSKLGQRLLLRRGEAASVIPALARETGTSSAFWNRRTDQPGIAADNKVIEAFRLSCNSR